MEFRAKRIKLNPTIPLSFELCHVDSSLLGLTCLTARQSFIIFCVVYRWKVLRKSVAGWSSHYTLSNASDYRRLMGYEDSLTSCTPWWNVEGVNSIWTSVLDGGEWSASHLGLFSIDRRDIWSKMTYVDTGQFRRTFAWENKHRSIRVRLYGSEVLALNNKNKNTNISCWFSCRENEAASDAIRIFVN